MTFTTYTLRDGSTIQINDDQICYAVAEETGYKSIALSNGKVFSVQTN